MGDAPRLELFARRNRLGWATWGNECLQHVTLVPPNDGTQRPGTRDATIANPDAMPGSLE